MATADPRVVQLSPAVTSGSNPLVKLLQHQTKEADVVKEKVRKLTKFKEDYEALKTRLETLPDKISYQVMVPFGKLAFLPGTLKHTNEILCLLGDNWFAERSAKQAAQIVARRIKDCDETLQKFYGELKVMDGWCDQTQKLRQELDLNQGVNIVEIEESEEWREEHRQKVREHKQKIAAFKKESANGGESHERTEEDLFRRLDELELEEELQHELDLLGVEDDEWEDEEEEEEDATNDIDVTESQEEENSKKKSVRWSETPDAVKQFRRDELILPGTSAAHDDDDNGEENKKQEEDTLKITFKHSVGSSAAAASSNTRRAKFAAFIPADAADSHPSSSAAVISSPSEIFRKFKSHTSTDSSGSEQPVASSSEPKSILKVKKSTTPVIEIVQRQKQKQNDREEGPDTIPAADPDRSSFLQQQQITAVGDEVKERGETASSQVVAEEEGGEESVNTHRPVSRFRAARMGKRI
uniref:Unconventional prefoldin RPB5 interactor n=1 Tax=Daphnia galeata TaxID=27404 RepID=A0A8J2RSR8_9CRUS|nr:unnamed protein product [Daphnia galeata]